MNSYAQETYKNWMTKASEYNEDKLSFYFDKYFSLFVAYNILYNENAHNLHKLKKIKKDERGFFSDNKSATEYILLTIVNQTLIDGLASVNDEINKIFDLIPSTFYIYNKNRDKKLRDDWRNNNNASALLSILYGIRCNMFHGSKDYEETQKSLLKPAIKVLEKLNEILFDEFIKM